jgi:DNA-directed RNA polymerase specialized sigma24 family protein
MNVIKMKTADDALIARIRSAWDRTKQGRKDWIEGTLELAQALAEARERHGNKEFSQWLDENGFAALDKNDRAALIGMAEDPEASRAMLEKSERLSWQLIWKNERPQVSRLPSVRNTRQVEVVNEEEPRLLRAEKTREPETVAKLKRGPERNAAVLEMAGRGFPGKEIATRLGLTTGQVYGIIDRNRRKSQSKPKHEPVKPPMGPRNTTGRTFLKPEEVDPDFKGTSLEYRSTYGHVTVYTKTEREEVKRQEILHAWIGALDDLEKVAAKFANVPAPEAATLAAYLAKTAGRADRFKARIAKVERALAIIFETIAK